MTLTPLRRAAAITAGTAAVLLLGLLTYLTTLRGREAAAWVGHTYEVLASLETAQGRAVDAETGVRGYAATGVDRFLEPYVRADRDAARELVRLRRLTLDNPSQAARLDTLDARLARVFAHLDSAVALTRAGALGPTRAVALLTAGKARMDAVRAAAAAVSVEERRLLAVREAENARLRAVTGWVVLGETLAAAGCVIVVGLLLAAAARAQQRHADAEHAARVAAEAVHRQAQAQAAELEVANEELQATAVELEEQTEAADRARAAAEAARIEADAARAHLAGVLAGLDEGLVAFDAGWRYTYVNAAAARMLGRAPEAFVGRTPAEVFPEVAEPMQGPSWAELRRVMATRRPESFERHLAPPGRWYEHRVYPATDGGVLLFVQDITPRKQAEAERERLLVAERAARAEAERANRTRADFLASMSHELRTPLNAIGGYVQLMDMGLHGPVTDAQRVALGRVQQAQARLLGLITDVLNFAKLEAGKVEFDLRETAVADVVREVMPLVEPQLRAKGLRCRIALPDATGGEGAPLVWADPAKLAQVLLNLLSNAVKFTPSVQGPLAPEPGAPGCVTIEFTAERLGGRRAGGVAPPAPGAADGPRVAYLRVRDTGVGLPRDKQDVIFDPFVQVSTGLTREAEGAGLGLTISRDLARGMGGDLLVESVPDVGSTFTLVLPAV